MKSHKKRKNPTGSGFTAGESEETIMKFYAYKSFGMELVKEFSSKKERDKFIESTKDSDGLTEWEPISASKAHTRYFEECVRHEEA